MVRDRRAEYIAHRVARVPAGSIVEMRARHNSLDMADRCVMLYSVGPRRQAHSPLSFRFESTQVKKMCGCRPPGCFKGTGSRSLTLRASNQACVRVQAENG